MGVSTALGDLLNSHSLLKLIPVMSGDVEFILALAKLETELITTTLREINAHGLIVIQAKPSYTSAWHKTTGLRAIKSWR